VKPFKSARRPISELAADAAIDMSVWLQDFATVRIDFLKIDDEVMQILLAFSILKSR